MPDFSDVPPTAAGKGHTVFNIYVDGVYTTSRRYSEFVALHKKLKARFRWFEFPPLPGKKINGIRGGLLGVGCLWVSACVRWCVRSPISALFYVLQCLSAPLCANFSLCWRADGVGGRRVLWSLAGKGWPPIWEHVSDPVILQ